MNMDKWDAAANTVFAVLMAVAVVLIFADPQPVSRGIEEREPNIQTEETT